MDLSDQLRSIFQTARRTNSHGAFYRLPEEQTFQAILADQLSELSHASEGFVIHPYHAHEKGHVIAEKISIAFGAEMQVTYHVEDFYTESFKTSLKSEGGSETIPGPYYQKEAAHISTEIEFMEQVQKAILKIDAGTFSKVVLSRISKNESIQQKEETEIFLSLCAHYPSAFISLMFSPVFGTWIGASPEPLLLQEGSEYETVALAGTKSSGAVAAFTEKEIEEQKIIIDSIERQLLGKGIEVRKSEALPYDTGLVTHLRSEIRFNADPVERMKILEALHPTPAVGGYPKYASLLFIDQTEQQERALYAGYLGILKKDTMKLYVNIRCLQRHADGYDLLYAGAGITRASDPQEEWIETGKKIRVIGDVL